MREQIICSGFGGQGIMTMGKLLAESGMHDGLEVSWLPSYGPEMRGGTANCQVVLSSSPIGSPIISGHADAVIAMNIPSVTKFLRQLAPGGVLVYNSSLIGDIPGRSDIATCAVPANDIASSLGELKAANMVMLGVYLSLHPVLPLQTVLRTLPALLGPGKERFVDIDARALEAGREAALEQVPTG